MANTETLTFSVRLLLNRREASIRPIFCYREDIWGDTEQIRFCYGKNDFSRHRAELRHRLRFLTGCRKWKLWLSLGKLRIVFPLGESETLMKNPPERSISDQLDVHLFRIVSSPSVTWQSAIYRLKTCWSTKSGGRDACRFRDRWSVKKTDEGICRLATNFSDPNRW